MFDGMFQFFTAPDGSRHFYVHTESPVVAVILVAVLFVLIFLASALCYFITRFVLVRIASRLARGERRSWLREAVRHKVFDRLAPLVPAYIIYLSAPLVQGVSFPVISALGVPLEVLAACFMVLTATWAARAFLTSIEDHYSHYPFAREKPIKSFLEVAAIVLYLIALIAIISLLLQRSPMYFLTGVSAMTALLIIVFRDSLLGFVASIQLAVYDMVRIGDWIEVPGFTADGVVIDISLNTIKVQNFDNSIVMLPSYGLIANGVRNWRGMFASGGRRVKHAVNMDFDTIRFCDAELIARLKASEDMQVNIDTLLGNTRLTNLGLFRRYLIEYFRHHPAVRNDMPLVVRQLQSEQYGLPLEVFLFVDATRWDAYEALQTDMFDHVYGVLPLFGLRVFQKR
jgi:miniconductance mechanosensitive channel